jgi:membrane protein required for colicin V production
MNSFDIVIYAGLLIAVVTGFNAGLLRSAATIVGYLIAMPIAAWVTTSFGPKAEPGSDLQILQSPFLLFGMFLLAGIVLGKLLRLTLDEVTGADIGLLDRLAGAALGAVRLGLVAVTLVLIFDQLIPANRQPKFLSESSLRPLLSRAGEMGIKSLPPEATALIARLKRQYGL